MLEMTLATEFVPGVNLKGKVPGATWLYLLPHIDLQRTICLGAPRQSTIEVLTSFSHEVLLVLPQEQDLSTSLDIQNVAGVQYLKWIDEGTLPLVDRCADLIFLADEQNIKKFRESKKRQAEIVRLLAAKGVIYYEGREKFLSRSGARTPGMDEGALGLKSSYWLTPLLGEMQTAVPYVDAQTIAYFLQEKLNSPMFDLSSLVIKRAKHLAAGSRQRSAGHKAAATNNTSSQKSKTSLKYSLRRTGIRLMGALEQAEQWVDRKRPMRRYGVIHGGVAQGGHLSPPQYMREIAERSGLNLDQYRWGLSARGEYSSRKMLFYLFDRSHGSERVQPNIIVKMVRDPSFSYRLENEAQSLRQLAELGFDDPEILPQVMFAGRHAGLAVVGESIIQGVPFREKSTASAKCSFGLAALDWFIELGAATADVQKAAPQEIGQALLLLFERFNAIYEPTTEQRDFLATQIDKISCSNSAIPLVFQHGDPGPWNMLVTPNGRVAILDWEAAEVAGMPAWDLFYFMRSYSLDAARKSGIKHRLAGFKQQFLDDTQLSQLFVKTIQRYIEAIDLDGALIEPLFYTCWMHRALKESMRLDPARLEQGHFANLIWWCRENSDSVTLQRLFFMPSKIGEEGELLRNL
ncbi:MAG: aminoglycoside phosphotransferase family protein [Candidatus Promineifilaceae bacterium]|nr:aminoglycoside phosphotransferase family protein [Candidatus Promineifilaceae bacterium]